MNLSQQMEPTIQSNTTTFIEDAEATTASFESSTQISSLYLKESEDRPEASISRFLSKPFELSTGQFSNLDNAVTFPYIRLPYDYISQPIFYNKLRGYLGFRGDLVITLQVNAERFQQGRYMVIAIPVGGAPGNAKTIDYCNSHSATLVQRTQLPHVEIDLNTETSCTLRLPFTSSHNFYSMQYNSRDTSANFYWIRIVPYSTLVSPAGSVNCKFTLWCHMENVDLIGQAIPIELQSRSMVKTSKKAKSSSQQEADNAGVGPVQSVAIKISKAVKFIPPIPFISDYTNLLGWAADIVGNMAGVFGWSAPSNLSPQIRMTQTAMQYAANVNKVDMSLPLSLDAGNAVAPLPGVAGTDIDELDITRLCSIFSHFNTFIWASTRVEEDLLARFNAGLYPVNVPTQQSYGATVVSSLSPCQFMANKFSMWRGSVIFRFKIVKTEFHSGRISIDFNPSVRGYTSPFIDDANAPYVHRDIIDIRDLNEIIIEIPYICNTPYLQTGINNSNLYGALEIRVIDPLVAPSTVSPNITFLCEYALGNDSEFAGFNNRVMNPICNIQFQSRSITKTIGDTKKHNFQLETSKISIGERILNMRAYVKRFEPIVSQITRTDALDDKYHILPFAYSMSDSVANRPVQQFTDTYGQLCSMFAYSRGGIRLKAVFQGVVNAASTRMFLLNEGLSRDTILTFDPITPTVSTNLRLDYRNQYNLTPADAVKANETFIPMMHGQHSRNNVVHSVSPAFPYVIPGGLSRHDVSNIIVSTQTYTQLDDIALVQPCRARYYRAGADDCDFSFFVSIPPMAVEQATL